MKLHVRAFQGEQPRANPRLLGERQAQTALNCDLRSGAIRPWHQTQFVATPSKASAGTVETIYLFADTYWFNWRADVDVHKGPIAGDTEERTYWTGDGYPKVTNASIATATSDYPSNHYRLGLPAPASAPILSVSGTITDDDPALEEVRYYVYTYVTAWGEEGPPSPLSAETTWAPGQTVTVSGMDVAPVGAYNVTKKRIYRSNAGTSSAVFQYVTEIPVATTSHDDSLEGGSLGEVLPSSDWLQPPEDMHSLTSLPNGIMAGAAANEVLFSEPYQPHAWPSAYRLTTDRDVVGLGSYDTNVVVCTDSNPYLVTGSDPESMSMTLLNINQGCVSKRGIVGIGSYGVLYPSADGLVLVSSEGAQIITERLMTPREWQAYKPESIHAYNMGGLYVAFYDTGTEQGGFIFDPLNQADIGLTFIDTHATAGFAAPSRDSLYLAVGGQIVQWDKGANPLTARWKSKQFVTGYPTSFASAQVIAESYDSLECKVWADGTLKHTQTVTNRDPFRLPSGFRATVWEIQVEGTDTVTDVLMASTNRELAES